MINGYEHWTTSDGIRTHVGPLHHAATKGVLKARQRIKDRLRGKGKRVNPTTDATVILPAVEEDRDATVVITNIGDQITQAISSLKLPTFSVTPEPPEGYKGNKRPKKSRWQRFKAELLDCLYDDLWHTMARRTAGTVLMWSFTVAASIVLGKGLLWVLFL